jgi:hypothetical protein
MDKERHIILATSGEEGPQGPDAVMEGRGTGGGVGKLPGDCL